MLSFEIVDDNTVQIYCDQDGVRKLMNVLRKLEGAPPSHVHLLTPSCGGKELSEHNPFGREGVSEVIITTGGD
jgi:hypothetical protein